MNSRCIGKHKNELDTPCLVIDKSKLINNIKTMQEYAIAHGKKVRPHAKTHKCPTICKLQLDNGSIGISISKPAEALELAKNGIKDILITSPIVTNNKFATLANILKLSPKTIVVTDSVDNINQLSKLANCLVWTGCPNDFISFILKHIRCFIKNVRFNSIPFYDGVKWCFHF